MSRQQRKQIETVAPCVRAETLTRKPQRASGRKTKLAVDPKLTDRFCALVEDGCSVRTACEATGLSESSFHRYMRLGDPESGDDHDPRFLQFWLRSTRARGEGKARLIRLVQKAARSDGKLALELLRSIAPNEYSIHRADADAEASEPLLAPPPSITETRVSWAVTELPFTQAQLNYMARARGKEC